MPNVVGDRFQITIDKALREELGIQPGDIAIERVEDHRLVVDFMPRPHHRSQLGAFRRPDQQPITDWESYFNGVWAARSAEIQEALAEDSARHGDETHHTTGGR